MNFWGKYKCFFVFRQIIILNISYCSLIRQKYFISCYLIDCYQFDNTHHTCTNHSFKVLDLADIEDLWGLTRRTIDPANAERHRGRAAVSALQRGCNVLQWSCLVFGFTAYFGTWCWNSNINICVNSKWITEVKRTEMSLVSTRAERSLTLDYWACVQMVQTCSCVVLLLLFCFVVQQLKKAILTQTHMFFLPLITGQQRFW